jgi:hypothetical protein
MGLMLTTPFSPLSAVSVVVKFLLLSIVWLLRSIPQRDYFASNVGFLFGL